MKTLEAVLCVYGGHWDLFIVGVCFDYDWWLIVGNCISTDFILDMCISCDMIRGLEVVRG